MKGRPHAIALLLLVALSCRSLPSGPASSSPRRVLLLSLDGAGASELHRLYREGELKWGGFARFFREGQVAERLVPVNPTLTATNHISLATGYVAGETGIVSDTLHLSGRPLPDTVSGFAATIDTETLWEAARRQGKRVGVITWPGADGTGERRRADWGMVYANDPDRRAELVSIDPADWQSRGSSFAARVHVGGSQGGQTFDILALDRYGQAGYDAVSVVSPPETPVANTVVHVGEWGSIPCRLARPEGEPRQANCTFKLLELGREPGSLLPMELLLLSMERLLLAIVGDLRIEQGEDCLDRPFGCHHVLLCGPPEPEV